MSDLSLSDIEYAKTYKKAIEGLVERVTSDYNMVVRLNEQLRGVIPFDELYEKKEAIPHRRVGTYIKFFVKDIISREGMEPLIILSPRDYALSLKEQLFKEYYNGNEIIVSGLVVNTTEKSAFVDIGGGLIGRLYIKEVGKVRLNNIDELIRRNTNLEALIKEIDDQQRIQLSTIKLYGTFDENIKKLDLKVGVTCIGIVRGSDPHGNGVFIQLTPNLVGLADFPRRFHVFYGDKVSVNVRGIEYDKKGVSLDILNVIERSGKHDTPPTPARIIVPDVEGLSYLEAVELLQKNGCRLIIRIEENSGVDMEKVIRTEPHKNSYLGEFESVHVVVSKGQAKEVTVPVLNGIKLCDAEKVLSDLSIQYVIKREFHEVMAENTVIESSIPAGKKIRTDTSVIKLLVSKGKKVRLDYEISPFAICPNEKKVLEKKGNFKDIDRLVTMFYQKIIQEIDIDILLIISQHKFIVSHQITNILIHKLSYDITQEKVQKRLEKLMTYGILARYYFTIDEVKKILRVYCLELSGSIFLHKITGEPYNKQFKHFIIKPSLVKRYLTANQVYISYLLNPCMGKVELVGFDKKLYYTIGGRNFHVKSHLNILFDQENKKIDCNFEILRRTEDWNDEKWEDKLRRYEEYYETLTKEADTKYNLIIVCEDEAHIVKAYEAVDKFGIYIKGVGVYYTCDLQHNPNDLSKLPEALVSPRYLEENREYRLL